jgi:hypothetical protein
MCIGFFFQRSVGFTRLRPSQPQRVSSACLSLSSEQGDPPMQLLTQEIRQKLPPLGSQENLGGKAVVHVKFFTPDSSWTWFGTEFDGQDTFFGLVDGHEKELGYFSLSELQSVRGPMGLAIERDLYWQPKTLEEISPELFRQKPTEREIP